MPNAAADGSVIDELEDVLCAATTGAPPSRSDAITYSRCRSALLESAAKDLLPGFLYQCSTVFRFREFVTLYDPDPALREAFVRKTFARCREMIAAPMAHYAGQPDPEHWMR